MDPIYRKNEFEKLSILVKIRNLYEYLGPDKKIKLLPIVF